MILQCHLLLKVSFSKIRTEFAKGHIWKDYNGVLVFYIRITSQNLQNLQSKVRPKASFSVILHVDQLSDRLD